MRGYCLFQEALARSVGKEQLFLLALGCRMMCSLSYWLQRPINNKHSLFPKADTKMGSVSRVTCELSSLHYAAVDVTSGSVAYLRSLSPKASQPCLTSSLPAAWAQKPVV